MTQVALLAALHLVGLVVCLAWGPRRFPVVCAALAFPVGLAIAAGLALLSLHAGAPVSATVIGGGCAIGAAALWVARRRWQPDRWCALALAAGSAAFIVIAVLFTVRDITLFAQDSYRLVLAAQTFGADGISLDARLTQFLADDGPLPIAAYGLAALGDQGFLHALQPSLLACTAASVAATAERGAALLGAPRWVRAAVAALAPAALVLQPAMLHSALLVGGGGFTAAYLVCFVGVWWLAEIRNDASMTPVALVGLVALFLVSVQSAALGLVLLAVALLPSRLSDRDLDVPVGAAVATIIAWLAVATLDFSKDGNFTSGEASWLLAGLLAVYLLWVAVRAGPARRAVRLLPAASLAAAAAIAALTGGLRLDDSAASIWTGLGESGWSLTLVGVAILAAAGLLAGRMPGERLLAGALLVCALAAVWVGRRAQPALVAAPSGAIHMLAAHAFAIACLYLPIKVGWVLGSGRADAARPEPVARPEGRPGRELGIAAVSLLAGGLAFNLHFINVAQIRADKKKRLAPVESISFLDAALAGGPKARFQAAVYYRVAARTDGGHLRLPRELSNHVPYFRDLAGLEVTEGPAALPAAAAAALRPLVEQTVKFDLKRGDVRDLHFIWGRGPRDWVLATTPDSGPVFWIPRDLYLKSGGDP